MHAAHAPRVIIFQSCANFCSYSGVLSKGFGLFCAILGIFANFARFWAFFAHILCANFSDSKFCVGYFVSFFHLCLTSIFSNGGRVSGRIIIMFQQTVILGQKYHVMTVGQRLGKGWVISTSKWMFPLVLMEQAEFCNGVT